MTRTFANLTMALLACSMAPAATISTTLTVNATASISFTTGAISVTGPATLTNIGTGTFSASISASAIGSGSTVSTPFTITLAGSAGTITGTLAIPPALLTGQVTSGSVSATVTGGTGTYAGATGQFPNLSGTTSGSIATSLTLTFTGTGTINTAGSGGGGGGAPTPTITTVQNNYGLIAPGLPNYGIAPSTLFFIQGSSLANNTTNLISSASPGLPTTLNGVTVNVTAGGTTTACPLYYLSPTQIDAVLPGATAVGNATITVNNNGTTSAAFQITVVQSAFGILSYNGSLAAVYDANNNIITSANSANPGQAIVLWGSGVGFDPKDDDKLFPQSQDDLTSIPMQVYVGGVQAAIAYRGRSQFPGVDQVVITVPASAPTGCYVSLLVVSGNIVSNSTTMPIAASGRTCTDTNSGLTPDILAGLSGKTTIKEGILTVGQSTSISGSNTQTANTAAGIFQSVTGFLSSAGANAISIGSCIVIRNASSSPISTTATGLDAGSSIAVNGPGGSITMSPLSIPGVGAGFYTTSTGTVPGSFIPASGGAFTFDNGSGGKDVGHFSATLNLPAAFTWSNAASISSVSRSQGVTVTWSGGASGSFVNITGSSTSGSVTVSFTCEAPLSAGQFTVPPPITLSLPAGNGSLSVGDNSNLQLFTASGLDLGILIGSNTTTKTLSYN